MPDHLNYSMVRQGAKPPTRKHPTDAGVDVYSNEPGSVRVEPHSCSIFKTGITFEIPEGLMLQAWPKSKNNHLVGAGIIDPFYQGEVLIKVVNYSDDPLLINEGDAVAQLVLVPVLCLPLQELSSDEIHPQRSARAGTGGIMTQKNKE
jgi:dUTP pyrophosphatase